MKLGNKRGERSGKSCKIRVRNGHDANTLFETYMKFSTNN